MKEYKKIFSRQDCPPKIVFEQYSAGLLGSKEAHLFEKHLQECPACADVLVGILSYTQPTFFEEDLLSAHRLIERKSSSKKYYWYVAAACTGLMLLIGYGMRHMTMQENKIAAVSKAIKPGEKDTLLQAIDSIQLPTISLKKQPYTNLPGNLIALKQEPVQKEDSAKMKVLSQKDELVDSKNEQEKKETEKKILNIQMQPDTMKLEEVVAIGYGSQERRSVTGSVSSVKSKQLRKSKLESVDLQNDRRTRYVAIGIKIIKELAANGKLDSALAVANDLVLMHPGNDVALWAKAEVLIKSDRKEDAELILKELSISGDKYKNKAKRRLKKSL